MNRDEQAIRRFEDGWTLEILDTDEYESCHISPNIYM